MTIDQVIELLKALAAFIQAVVWPVLVLFLVIYLGEPLKKFMQEMSKFNFKAGPSGLEASAERQAEAAALLGVAAANKGGSSGKSNEEQAREIASVVNQAASSKSSQQLAKSLVLWIDDMPSRSFWERKALEAFGVRFSPAKTVAEALGKLTQGKYDVVVYNLGRGADLQMGYALYDEKQKHGDTSPVVFYGAVTPEQKAEARRRGIVWQASNPLDLFQTVSGAIQSV
jgi:CheY-specific phosphatase CheX